MIANHTLFACGPGAELIVAYFAFLGCLIITGALFLGNICLLFALRDAHVLRHGTAMIGYTLFAAALWNEVQGTSGNYYMLVGGVVTLPVLVIGHFIWLVRLVRRERRVLRAESQPA